ncbi:MAG: FHA domain-containing protein [Lachnospiraceae bacterium]|jgi:hypothetical protein|nr:FHA domain-containing protein [Lachnospiraceae bacterium]
MMEISFQKDMNKNYMIVKCPVTADVPAIAENNYRLRMMTENEIHGLLRADRRSIDGEAYLYYEISSLQSLRTVFLRRRLDREKALFVLAGLCRVLRELSRYLLSGDGLVLEAEYVYFNWEKEEVFFLYYPYEYETSSGQLLLLMEYLVRIIDHRDEQLTDALYRLCQQAERDTLTVDEIEQCLEKLSSAALYDDGGLQQARVATTEAACIDNEKAVTTKTRGSESYQVIYGIDETQANINEELKQKKRFMIMTVVSAAGVIGTAVYRSLFALGGRELLLSWILLALFSFFFLMTGAVWSLLVIKGRREAGEESLASVEQGEHSNSRCNYFREPGKRRRGSGEDRISSGETPIHGEENKSMDSNFPDAGYGDTIFYFEEDEACENKLYGMGKASSYIIAPGHFPFTIGKMGDTADFCLKDTSISRIHAQLSKKDDSIQLTDLNSTNGTYQNGIRLDPHETVSLVYGDEVRMGRLVFEYR